MEKKRNFWQPGLPAALGLFLFLIPGSLAGAENNGEGRVGEVTIYRNRALVTRSLQVDLSQGGNRIEITGLPANLDQDSLRARAEGPSGTFLEGFETRMITVEQRENVEFREAEVDLRELQSEQARWNDLLATLHSQREFLRSIQVSVPKEIGRSVLKGEIRPESWQGAFDFLGRNLKGLGVQERGIRKELPDLKLRIAAARARLAKIQSKGKTRSLTAVVALNAPTAGQGEVLVEYLTGPASWYPLYEARYDRDGRKVEFLEKGMVRQETGEDWTGIQLALSTARPGRPLDLPEITVLELNRGRRPPPPRKRAQANGPNEEKFGADFIEGLPVVGRDYRDVLILGPGVADADGDGNVNIHGSRDRDVAPVVTAITSAATQTVVTHRVPQPQDLPSDGEFHRIRIAASVLAAEQEEFRAVPRFREGVFLRAAVKNGGAHSYLAGKVVAFDGPNLLGSFRMEEIAPGEEFKIPFGPDPRFRAKRQQISRVVDSGKRQTTVTYLFRTTLESFHQEVRTVSIEDRIPVSGDQAIQVRLLAETTPGWEKDPETPGLLRWSVELPAREKREIDLAYEVRFPTGWYLPGLE